MFFKQGLAYSCCTLRRKNGIGPWHPSTLVVYELIHFLPIMNFREQIKLNVCRTDINYTYNNGLQSNTVQCMQRPSTYNTKQWMYDIFYFLLSIIQIFVWCLCNSEYKWQNHLQVIYCWIKSIQSYLQLLLTAKGLLLIIYTGSPFILHFYEVPSRQNTYHQFSLIYIHWIFSFNTPLSTLCVATRWLF